MNSSLFKYSLTKRNDPPNLNELSQDTSSANMVGGSEDAALLALLRDANLGQENAPSDPSPSDPLDELANIEPLAIQSSNQVSDGNRSSIPLENLLGETMPAIENTPADLGDANLGDANLDDLGAILDTELDAGTETGAGLENEIGPGPDDGFGQYQDTVQSHTFILTRGLLESILEGSKINKKTVCIGLCTKVGK